MTWIGIMVTVGIAAGLFGVTAWGRFWLAAAVFSVPVAALLAMRMPDGRLFLPWRRRPRLVVTWRDGAPVTADDLRTWFSPAAARREYLECRGCCRNCGAAGDVHLQMRRPVHAPEEGPAPLRLMCARCDPLPEIGGE